MNFYERSIHHPNTFQRKHGMKPVLVLCGILTFMANAIAQETATLEIPEPGEGGPSLRVLGDAEIEGTLKSDKLLSSAGIDIKTTDGFYVNAEDERAAARLRLELNLDHAIGLDVESAHSASVGGWSAMGVRSQGTIIEGNSDSKAFGIHAKAIGGRRNYAVYGEVKRNSNDGSLNYAGYFEGDVSVQGNLHCSERIRVNRDQVSNPNDREYNPHSAEFRTKSETGSVHGLKSTSINEHKGSGSAYAIEAYAYSKGYSYGIKTEAFGKGDGKYYGLWAKASSNSEGICYGIYAETQPNPNSENYAAWFEGDVVVKGDFKIKDWTISQVPDYVFKEDYKLRSLQEVEEYVTTKSHLPEVPSAEEIQKNGLDLAEMNMVLLKKVEELTLYTIQQQKQIDELRTKLDR